MITQKEETNGLHLPHPVHQAHLLRVLPEGQQTAVRFAGDKTEAVREALTRACQGLNPC